MTTTTTATAIPAIVMPNAAAANAAALSAASTPAGSAYSSPAAAVSAKALAPKKLIVRPPLRASFKVKSRTVFPSTERPVKAPSAPVIRGKDAPLEKRGTTAEEDAEIARNLPPNPYRKKDAYGNPYYRAWSPADKGGCPQEHRMMVLVHFAPMGLETQEDKPADVYMHFETYKRHHIGKGIKEWSNGVKFGADLMFFEDEQLRANRIAIEGAGGKAIQKKGRFCCVWRFTHADEKGYDKFMAEIDANLKKRSWTEADR